MSTSLKELGESIKKAQTVATSDPGTDVNVRRMRLGNIMQAKEQLRLLNQEYRKALISRAAFAIVSGSQADKFAKLAEEEFSCFSVNVEDFYAEMTDKVPAALYQGVSSSQNLFEHIGAALEDKARDLDIISFPALIFESKFKKMINNKEEMVKLAKTAINDKIGGEIVGLDALQKITQKVIDSGLSGKTIPVVLVVEDSSLVEELAKGLKRSLSRNTFIISTGGKIDKKLKDVSLDVIKSVDTESVEKSLLKMKENLV
jgi:hypothetical protein